MHEHNNNKIKIKQCQIMYVVAYQQEYLLISGNYTEDVVTIHNFYDNATRHKSQTKDFLQAQGRGGNLVPSFPIKISPLFNSSTLLKVLDDLKSVAGWIFISCISDKPGWPSP